ncbi:MAG: 50S ribosome-binding GTPase [Anaerolineae bacterium]
MPTNLPPEAMEAERRYRAAQAIEEKITSLEEYISLIPKHKGTDHLRADLRRKLSKLKDSAQMRKKVSKRVSVYSIDKEGAGQLVIVGMPNVGKSALVAALTNATPEVSEAPFTTWEPTPGMMPVNNIQVQLIDTPPLNQDYIEPELLNLIRRADLVLLMIDVQTHPVQQLKEAIAILEEHRIVPLHRQDQYSETHRVNFKPLLVLVNKCDDEEADELFEIFCELVEEDWPLLSISAMTGRNADRLKQTVYEQLGIMRIYSKAPGKEPDYDAPFVMETGGTVEQFARKIHQDFSEKLKAARVWGTGVYDGQMVGRDHILHDGDVVELRT